MTSTGSTSDGDVSKGIAINIAIAIVVAVTVIVVALRWSVKIWITRNVGWDDWTILFAIVRQIFSDFAKTGSNVGSGGQHYRRRPRLCGGTLRLREIRPVSHRMANNRVQEIYLWRMDPDFCDLDVDQDLNLPLLDAYPSQQSAYPTSPGRSRLFSSIQHRSDHPLDRSVPAGRQSLA